MTKHRWLTNADIETMPPSEKIELLNQYVNPGMMKLFKILGFDRPWGISAQGTQISLRDGRQILDMTGGSSVLGLGHNHPRILQIRKKFSEEKTMEVCKTLASPYVAALANNMAQLLPGDLQYSFFCESGAAAIEGALKLAQKYAGKERQGIVYCDHSFHGKSHAAMSISSLEESRQHFQLLEKCYQVPFGNADALEALFQSRLLPKSKNPDVCAFVLEAIHGSRIMFPPQGYLKHARELCAKYNVLMIMDEIYIGFGRTGHWFAFESENIVPDIVCYSKAFGGGKASIAGYTARRDVFLKAYGKTSDSMIHSSTYSGMSEECATALEAINILKDEQLIENANEIGPYFQEKLEVLKQKYPKRIKDIRGKGLLWGIELNPFADTLKPLIEKVFPEKTGSVYALTGAIMLSELFHEYNILAYTGLTQRNLLVFSPPLIIKKQEIDQALEALESIVKTNWATLCQKFLSRYLANN